MIPSLIEDYVDNNFYTMTRNRNMLLTTIILYLGKTRYQTCLTKRKQIYLAG